MSTDIHRGATCKEAHSDLSIVTFRDIINFDSRKRQLELIISQAMPDEDADPFENLVLPLKVLLVEIIDSQNLGEAEGYEDLFMFTHDGDFMGHLYREFRKDTDGRKNYPSKSFMQDGDISKLYRYGETIRNMMDGRNLGYVLDNNPTVRRLKEHTLWQRGP